jgi:hypothetical protein
MTTLETYVKRKDQQPPPAEYWQAVAGFFINQRGGLVEGHECLRLIAHLLHDLDVAIDLGSAVRKDH